MNYKTSGNKNKDRIVEIISELTEISKEQIEKAILKYGFNSVLEDVSLISEDDSEKLNDLKTVLDFVNRED